MGLAPYGKASYKEHILTHLIDLKADGSFRLRMEYFNYCTGLTMTNRKFHRLFGGPPRKPESAITQRHLDLAKSIQKVAEEIILRMARHVRHITGQKNLCLAGGVALNCVANGRILREGSFDGIWIQPAAGDAGGALGAALFTWYQYRGNARMADGKNDSQQGSYLGPAYDTDYIRRFLTDHGIPFEQLTDEVLLDRITDLISKGKVIGWFQGRMEFGPRALGNRSIIGDARLSDMQELMNLKIKFRENFRPFAPSVLVEKTSGYFELDGESPYMLLVAPVQKGLRLGLTAAQRRLTGLDQLSVKRSTIPAVTHVDYSARIHSVRPEANPRFYRLLRALDQKQGFGIIINTSFNVRGEPIVCSPEHAYRCFRRTNMDFLVMGNFLVGKKGLSLFDSDSDGSTKTILD
jgi:carbamoyltransferase